MTSWTTPRTWTVGELVTKAMMDTHVRDNLKYLKEHTDALEVRELVVVLNTDTALVAGDDLIEIPIPYGLDGYNFTNVQMFRGSGTGTPSVAVYNVTDSHDVLSSNVEPGTPGTINTSYDDVSAYDIIRIDVDDAGTNSLYCTLLLRFGLP